MPFTSESAKRLRGPGGRKKGDPVQRAAKEIARAYIEASVKPVLATYFQLAHGRIVNKWHEGKIVGQEFEADAGTTRHFIDKLLPDEHDKTPQQGNTVIQFIFGNERREIDVGLPQEEQRGNLNGGSIRLIGDEGGS